MRALCAEGYAEAVPEPGRRRRYQATVRLVAQAAQLGERLPLVVTGRRIVKELHTATGFGASLVIPSYHDVLVVAAAGGDAPTSGTLIPAFQCAAGRLLLSQRPAWRASVSPDEDAILAGAEPYRFAVPNSCEASRSSASATLAAVDPDLEAPLHALALHGAPCRLRAATPQLVRRLAQGAREVGRA